MYRTVDHFTGDLFDPLGSLGSRRRKMLEQGWAGLFRREVLLSLPVELLIACFHETHGRPTKDLYVILGCLLLQQMHDLSDADAVEALAFNFAWQYALDVRSEADATIDPRTLRNYRARIVENQLEERLFQTVTDRLIRSLGVDTSHQRIDSTVLRSHMRKLGRLGTFTETLERFLRQLARSDSAAYQQLEEKLRERYRDGARNECFGLAAKPSEANRHLKEVAQDLLMLVQRFAGTPAADWPEYGLLQRLLDEHCEVREEQGEQKVLVLDEKRVSGDSLQNPSDPDSTFNGHKGQGFMMQVMETYSPQEPAEGEKAKPDLITHVSVNKMTDPDSQALVPALQDAGRRDVGPQQLLGDTHYGLGDNVQKAAAEGAKLLTPAMPPRFYKQGKMSLEDFELDEQNLVVRCPGGYEPISTSATEKNYQARFDARTCSQCPLRQHCPVQKPRATDPSAMRLQYDLPRLKMYHRRMAEREDSFKEAYRWRAGIEATMSRLKHLVGLGYLRVRGLAAVTYKAFIGALSLNIWRCAAVA